MMRIVHHAPARYERRLRALGYGPVNVSRCYHHRHTIGHQRPRSCQIVVVLPYDPALAPWRAWRRRFHNPLRYHASPRTGVITLAYRKRHQRPAQPLHPTMPLRLDRAIWGQA